MRNKIVLLKIMSLFLICLISCDKKSPTEIAPTTYVLQGVVRDNGAEYLGNGAELVANALVTLTDKNNSKKIITSNTNSQGKYSIQISGPVQYTLRVTSENFKPYEKQNFEITNDMNVDVTLIRSLTDIDGNVYTTVKIGNQWWIAENLKVTHYRNGDPIPNISDSTEWVSSTTGVLCHYGNNDANASTYGCIYNWFAVNDNRGLVPEGWHVPSDEEWKELEMYLGMSQADADDTNWRGTDEGGKLKEAGTVHWEASNTGVTNESGFTALPAGYRSCGLQTYEQLGKHAQFWSTTIGIHVWTRSISYFSSQIVREGLNERNGISVRCIKDN